MQACRDSSKGPHVSLLSHTQVATETDFRWKCPVSCAGSELLFTLMDNGVTLCYYCSGINEDYLVHPWHWFQQAGIIIIMYSRCFPPGLIRCVYIIFKCWSKPTTNDDYDYPLIYHQCKITVYLIKWKQNQSEANFNCIYSCSARQENSQNNAQLNIICKGLIAFIWIRQ